MDNSLGFTTVIPRQCIHVSRVKGLAYPRTCPVCKFGPCSSEEGRSILADELKKDPRVPLVYDPVTKAQHYNQHPSGIEVITMVRCLNFNMGSALKYVTRREGKEHARSLQSAKYYLKDQHVHGTKMVLNYAIYRILDKYSEAEPSREAQNFYRAFMSYLQEPVNMRHDILQASLQRLVDLCL